MNGARRIIRIEPARIAWNLSFDTCKRAWDDRPKCLKFCWMEAWHESISHWIILAVPVVRSLAVRSPQLDHLVIRVLPFLRRPVLSLFLHGHFCGAIGGGAHLRLERHALKGDIDQRDPDVYCPLWTSRWAGYLEREESGGSDVPAELPGRGWDEVYKAGSDDASEHDTEPCEGVDLNRDLGGLGLEGVIVDAEHKLLIPSGVCVAVLVHTCRELAIWVDPRDRVRAHGIWHWGQVLGRNQVERQKPPLGKLRSHRCMDAAPDPVHRWSPRLSTLRQQHDKGVGCVRGVDVAHARVTDGNDGEETSWKWGVPASVHMKALVEGKSWGLNRENEGSGEDGRVRACS